MKNLKFMCMIAAAAVLFSSCFVARSGVAIGAERYSYDVFDYGPQPHEDPALKATADEFSGSNSEVGFYIGAGLTGVNFTEKLSFAPEVNFISVKNLDEIQVPVLVRYEIIDKLSAHAGPAVGFFLDAGESTKSTTFGFDLGAAYEIIDKLSVQARFDLGLSNLLEDDYGKIRYNTFQMGVAYSF